jgi:hypothetical protein
MKNIEHDREAKLAAIIATSDPGTEYVVLTSEHQVRFWSHLAR